MQCPELLDTGGGTADPAAAPGTTFPRWWELNNAGSGAQTVFTAQPQSYLTV